MDFDNNYKHKTLGRLTVLVPFLHPYTIPHPCHRSWHWWNRLPQIQTHDNHVEQFRTHAVDHKRYKRNKLRLHMATVQVWILALRIPITQSECGAEPWKSGFKKKHGWKNASSFRLISADIYLALSFILLLEKELQGMQGWCWPGLWLTFSWNLTWAGWDLCVDRREIKVAKARAIYIDV